MIIDFLKFLVFVTPLVSLGFLLLNKVAKIKSIVHLIPYSISLGLSIFIFTCHSISLLTGPKLGSLITTIFLLILTITFGIFKKSELEVLNPLSKKQLWLLIGVGLVISAATLFAINKIGTYDRDFHNYLTLTMFHNDFYPPKDFFKPEYILMYHFGTDLIAGSISNLLKIEVGRCFIFLSSLFSFLMFTSFHSIAWALTKRFKASFIAGVCTYFGGGLLWLDAIIRYLTGSLPDSFKQWGFWQTFFNLGLHGGIYNAPSETVFTSTYSLGAPLLIFNLFVLWKILQKNSSKLAIASYSFISLFALFLTAEWLFTTYLAASFIFIFLFIVKNKNTEPLKYYGLLLVLSIVFNKTLGNSLFLQSSEQVLGRANIFNLGIKENLFTVTSWGRIANSLSSYQELSCFSWEFISEFGLSLILLPILIIYIIKSKNSFSILLLLCALVSMPAPLIIDFKLHPVDFNRMFAFGNNMIILLITCGAFTHFNKLFSRNFVISIYLVLFCTTPFSNLVFSNIFSPYISFNKKYTEVAISKIKEIDSFGDIKNYYSYLNGIHSGIKYKNSVGLKNEIGVLKSHSEPGDVAISSVPELPFEAGIYSIIPVNTALYKDLIYTRADNYFASIVNTLDPYLLEDLNIKWIVLSENGISQLKEEVREFLQGSKYFELVHKRKTKTDLNEIFIYKVKNLKVHKSDSQRKTAWIILNKQGNPIIVENNKIFLYDSFSSTLNKVVNIKENDIRFKGQTITPQPIVIADFESLINQPGLNLVLERKF